MIGGVIESEGEIGARLGRIGNERWDGGFEKIEVEIAGASDSEMNGVIPRRDRRDEQAAGINGGVVAGFEIQG